MTSFDIIFDNAGGITLQTSTYCHHYSDPYQVAVDVSSLLDPGAMPEHWDGNEPEHRAEYDNDVERNGGYRWVTDNDVMEAVGQIPSEHRGDWLGNISGHSERLFFERLFEIRDEAYLQQ